MNIGFACTWLKNRKRTWSHIPYSLFKSLEKIDVIELHDLDVSDRCTISFINILLNIKCYQGKVKSKYKFSTTYLRILEKNLINTVKKNQKLDAIIEIGDIGITEDIPFYLYQDLSLDLIIKYFQENNGRVPGWKLFNLHDLYKRKEWQMKIYEKSAGVFTMSRWLADSLIRDTGILPEKVHVMGAGINVKPDAIDITSKPKSKKDKIILFIGRCFFRKGGSLVVEAFKLLRKNYSSNIKLVIAGPKSWPLREKNPEGIIFLGDATWETLRKYYMMADVFCMPSYFEGFGIVFAESLSYGIPCIGRNIQAMPEIIRPGVNGYLINNDDEEELAIFFHSPTVRPIIRVLGFTIFIHAFVNIGVVYFQKELEFNKVFSYRFVGISTNFIVAVTAAIVLRSVWALVLGLFAENVVNLIVSYFIHPYRPHLSKDFGKAKELFGFGKWILGSSILVFIGEHIDDIFVGRVLVLWH